MRVRANVQPTPGQELARPHLVEENEGPDHLPFVRRQGPAHLEAAHIVGAGQEHHFHAIRRRRTGGILSSLPAHLVSPKTFGVLMACARSG
jgi:hypothetical protein